MKRLRAWIILAGFVTFYTVTAKAQCTADFVVTSKQCEGSPITFKATDSSTSIKFLWNFGDVFSGSDNIDSVANPIHLFTGNGIYKVSLIVYDTNGCRDTFIYGFRIYSKPKADFSFSNACSGLPTTFINASLADSGDIINQWLWNFGNGITSQSKDTVLQYSSTGTKQISLIIQSSQGCRDTILKNVSIYKKPTAQSDLKSACKLGQINFTADTIGQALSYLWDFGDSSFFSTRTANHVYKKTGYIYPVLTVSFATTKCILNIDSILIRNLPDASFSLNNDTQCFTNNSVCVKPNVKTPGLKSRVVIYDDGSFDDTTPLTDSVICHSYTNTKGGRYFITLELTDSNNCFSSYTAIKPAIIHPELKALFSFTGNNGCFSTKINFTNLSSIVPPGITRFNWNFGDSTSDSSQWTGFVHTYTKDGTFNISLEIEDTNGCVAKSISNSSITNTNFVIDATVDTSQGKCYSTNIFRFKQTPIPGASIRWDFVGSDSAVTFSTQYHYNAPGTYYPFVTIYKNTCRIVKPLQALTVHGPAAAIGNIVNRFQCQVKDTVYFENISFLYFNQSAKVLWNAGDPFAASCTTNTKLGIDIGKNCRFSVDSFSFKHMYQKGKEACYYVNLLVVDTVIGCRDSVWAAVPLMAPKAKGLFTPSTSKPCPGPEYYKSVTFDLNQSQPTCLKYSWKVMWDSLGARRTNNFDSNWVQNATYQNFGYSNPAGDSNGNVTMGLIVENGTDTNGMTCRDTGWFHNIVNVLRLNPNFSSNYNPQQYYCINSTLRFFPADSNQSKGNRYYWNFGDGAFLDTAFDGSVSHTYKRAGVYRVQLVVTNPGGCRGDTSMMVYIGVNKQFSLSSTLKCVGDTVQLFENNGYNNLFSYGGGYWSDPNRKSQGKEELRYNLGDGKGFQDLGPNPILSFNDPGTYIISMAVKDSAGCWDTLVSSSYIGVAGIYAKFNLAQDSVLCGQTLDLVSLSSTVDSTTMKGYTGDFIKSQEWDFGSKYAKSFIANPRRFFAIGDYKIKLKVTNSVGCSDSVTKDLVFIGPKAQFDFVNDTVGCEPLTVSFSNSSKDATDYIWQFGDAFKNAFGTNSDTNVTFTYRGAGTFYPILVARGLFTKNGISQVCDDFYPDTSLNFKRSVTVWELPKPDFKWFTNCSNATTTFTNTSKITNGNIVSEKWDFGDGTGSSGSNPVHTYSDTGYYRVVLKVISDRGCEDSIVKTIVVSLTPFADFGFTEPCQGIANIFTDSSFAFNDRIYLWQWDFGDATSSLLKNPTKVYAKDTGYFVKLKITNVAGCSDSIIKYVMVNSQPKPDFSFVNVCDQRFMQFKNQTVSKQGIQTWLWDFGDTTYSGAWNDSHKYKRPANYNVKLAVTTVKGCKDSVIKTFSVYPNPVAKIFIDNKNQCFKYHNVAFNDSSKIISGSLSSQWDLGDFTTSTQADIAHKYLTDGKFNIRLISTSNFNCKDTTYDSVSIYTMPKVTFSVNQNNQCQRYNQVVFTETGQISNGTYSVLWKFGNGDSASSGVTNYHYPDTGIYVSSLILTSNNGCKDTAISTVRLYPMPVSSFGINDSGQCLKGNQFTFTNSSTIAYGTLNYNWFFGDGNGSSNTNSNHNYINYGRYPVLLVSESNFGCKDSIIVPLDVYPMPIAGFIINDSLQCLSGNSFTFSNNTSLAAGTLSYSWDLGDLSSSTNVNPVHTYSNFGNFTVTLSARSSDACYDTAKQILEVYPMPVVKPFVDNSDQCVNNQSFNFADSSNIAFGSFTRTWKFGDSTISTVQNPVKTYNRYGNYDVWLINVSDNLCTDSSVLIIKVYPKPLPLFSFNDSSQCLSGNDFQFNNNTTIGNGTLRHRWNFGDGSSQLNTNAFHSYANFGNYKVTLNSVSDFGCSDSVSVQMVVYPMPVPSFFIDINEQCIRNNQFSFTNNTTIANGTLTYRWNFGDTGRSVLASPKYIYPKTGTYMVKLRATSGAGCIDSTFDFTTVNPMPQSGFSINDSTQCLNNQNFILTDTGKIAYGSFSRNWVFDDTTSSSLIKVNKTFTTDTSHWIKLILTSNRGCKDSVGKWVEVYSKPIMLLTVNDSDQCLRQNRFFFTNSTYVKKGTLSFQWDFGNKTGSSNVQTNVRYLAYGNYTTVLSALTNNGCVDTIRKSLRVDPMPLMSFTVNDTGQCLNAQSFVFKNNMSIPVGTLQHTWRFGDGNSSIVTDPTHQYARDSFYTVSLSGISNKGCRDSSTKIMAVFPLPQLQFGINDSIQCLYLNQYTFTNKSKIKYGTLTYNWSFRDGANSTSTDANHTYSFSGNYNVGLRGVSDLGCIDTFFKTITVGAMPKVDFLVNDRGQCLRSQNFVYTNRATIASGTMSHKWYFGDNDTLSGLNSAHKYSTIGTFTPKLISTSQYGCRDSFSKNVWVNPNAKASFTTNDSDQCRNQQNYIFTNTSSVSPGSIKGLLWNLGNGATSNQAQTGAYYPVSGTYTIILQTTTDSSCLDSAFANIKVYPKPAAWFTVNDSAQCLYGNKYEFTDVSFDTLGVNQYVWNINNESTQTTKLANYVFNSPGFKIISLVATSSRGCADTSQRQVYVKPMPDPGFEILKKYYCEKTGPYTFVPNTPGGTFFGRNIQSNIYNPILLWEDTITYKVTVNGCTDSSFQITNVYPGPVVDLGNDTTLCKFETLELNINSWQSTYLWNDGSNRPYLEILTPGKYWVTVKNICGIEYDTIDVLYRPVNCRFFLPTAFSPNGDGINDFYKPSIFNVTEMRYQIFNRWGELLHEGDVNDKGWDGYYGGEMAQEDAYMIYVSYSYPNGNRFVKITEKGTFVLLR